MEIQPQLQSDIARLLELIRQSNDTVALLKKSGKRASSLTVRQEKHLQRQYTAQLDQIMKQFKLGVHALED